jgi:hypothetical protein
MSVLVLSEEDLRRILREEFRALRSELPRSVEDRRVTFAEAAAAAGVSPATIRAWEAAGKIKRYGEGRSARFSLAEVLAVVPSSRATVVDPETKADEILGRRRHG